MKSLSEELIQFGYKVDDLVTAYFENIKDDNAVAFYLTTGRIKSLDIEGLIIFDESSQSCIRFDPEGIEEDEKAYIGGSCDKNLFMLKRQQSILLITQQHKLIQDLYGWSCAFPDNVSRTNHLFH